MSINWDILKSQIIEAAVVAVNATAEETAEIARDKAPVRKIFSGGRQTVRFKSASEIEADRDLRSRLGLAPEILATPEAVAAVRKAGLNPKKARGIGGKEFGFARTIEAPGRTHLVHRDINGEHFNIPHTDRPRNLANRANLGTRQGLRDRELGESGHLANRSLEAGLTGRGRYELRTERASSQARRPIIAHINQKGAIVGVDYVPVGAARLGGALRDSIRVVRATIGQYPVIKASVVAGGGDVDYAKYQELGTRHNPAHPFLRPALAVARDRLPDSLRRSLRRLGR